MALQGRWPLNEDGTANRVDTSGNGNDLAASASIAQAAGHGGGANLANNFTSSPYLSINDAAQSGLDFTGPFSISGWVKKTGINTNYTIASKWASGSLGYIFYVSSSNKLNFIVSSNGTSVAATATGSTSLSAGTMYHVMAIYDGSTLKVYLNNAENGSVSFSGSIANVAAPFRIGANGDGASPMNGVIDDVLVFDHALDTDERAAAYGYGDDFDGMADPAAALEGDIGCVATLTADLTTHGAAVLEGSLACEATLTGELTASGAPAALAGSIACVTTLTAEFPGVAATLSGVIHDRQGNVINCSTYNIRINVYPVGNIALPPLGSQLVTASSGAWSISSTNFVAGVKYIVTFEFIGTYTPLGDVDIAGCDVMTAY